MTSIAEMLRTATARLAEAGVEAPRREARLLLELATAIPRAKILSDPELELTSVSTSRFEDLVMARASRKPMAYLRGTQEFYGIDFLVGPGVLVPRPETELIIDVTLRRFADRSAALRILDLGTGSGCLLLTLLRHYPQASGVGVDVSGHALGWARRNAERLGLVDRVRLQQGSWSTVTLDRFDLIVANPPYIRSDAMASLQPEVGVHEPLQALDGGADGLRAYREIAADLDRRLSAAGMALIECGQGQAEAVGALFTSSYLAVERHLDLAGIERCLEVNRAERRTPFPGPNSGVKVAADHAEEVPRA